MFLSDKLQDFYFNLELSQSLPGGVEVMNPYAQSHVRYVCSQFFQKYFSDNQKRILILGINPGRFGAGVTGITFTDPIRLENKCGIQNNFVKRPEVSSVFIYELIKEFGGPEKFFSRFILSAVCPLGFISSGKNINYYDSKQLSLILKDFISETLKQQVTVAGSSDIVVCLGEGLNYTFLDRLNQEFHFFNEIITLPHPRWIMQYRFRQKGDYIREYIKIMEEI